MSLAQAFTNQHRIVVGKTAKNRMDDVGKFVERLMAAGCMPKVAAEVVTSVFIAGMQAAPKAVDETAERRRAWDRDRQKKKRERKSVESGGHTVERDHTQVLWTDGIGLLVQLGEPQKSARSNVGRWLKNYAAQKIMASIQTAYDKRAGHPVPYVTMLLGGGKNGANGKPTLSDAADDLIARAEERERKNGSGVPGHQEFGGLQDGQTIDGTVSAFEARRT